MDTPTDASSSPVTDAPPRWHVTLGDETRGPLTLAEVQRFWEAGRLSADSLVWAEGMPDWKPLTEVPELAHLETHPRATAAPAAASTSTFAPAPLGGTKAGAASAGPMPAAADLSALVHDELGAGAAAKATGAPAEFLPGDMPAITPAPVTNWQPPPMTATFWQKLAPKSRRGLKPIHLVVGGLVAALATAAAVIVVLVLPRQPAPTPAGGVPVAAVTPAAGPAATATTASAPETTPTTAAAGPAAATPATIPAAAATPAHAATTADPAPSAKVGGTKVKARPRGERETAAATESNAGEEAEPAAAPAEPAAAGGRPLTAADIKAGVKQGMPAVMGCIKAARTAGELTPGTHTLVLDWVIAPSGAVSDARVRGPAAVLNTSIPACFSQGMRQWRFPASPAGAPVKNFPFGPFTLK